MDWSASRYVAFEAERSRPVRDLLAAIPHGVGHAIDIGCGPGNSTEVLRQRFPTARVSGFDSSPDMIAAAKKRLPDVAFAVDYIENWVGSDENSYDLILANAVLQWLPDHETLLPKLLAKMDGGGSLAVQIPDNFDEPAHRLMREVAANGPWADKIGTVAHYPRHDAEGYYRLLKPHCQTVDVWRTIYHHVLPTGAQGIVDWFMSTGLRPFIDPLDDAEREAYLTQYKDKVTEVYPVQPDGSVLLPFPRLFFVATT